MENKLEESSPTPAPVQDYATGSTTVFKTKLAKDDRSQLMIRENKFTTAVTASMNSAALASSLRSSQERVLGRSRLESMKSATSSNQNSHRVSNTDLKVIGSNNKTYLGMPVESTMNFSPKNHKLEATNPGAENNTGNSKVPSRLQKKLNVLNDRIEHEISTYQKSSGSKYVTHVPMPVKQLEATGKTLSVVLTKP